MGLEGVRLARKLTRKPLVAIGGITRTNARSVIEAGADSRWLGVSTHNPEQLAEADQTSADYLAIGPVFATASKANPDPVVGLDGVRRARELTRKPLVAIGGITRANARSVIDAGADCRGGDIRLVTGSPQISRGIFEGSGIKCNSLNFVIPSEARDLHLAAKRRSLAAHGMTIHDR